MTTRCKKIQGVLIAIMLANLLVATTKLIMGITCGSNSLVADGIHSFSDSGANIAGLIGVWLSSRPVDAKHPYGYQKFEILASLFIGSMLMVMASEIIFSAINAIRNPKSLEIETLDFVLLMVTILVNFMVSMAELKFGKKLKSPVLIADSIHTRSDILVSLTVLLGLVGVAFGLPVWIDCAVSLGVAVMVGFSAWRIVKESVDILVDCAAIDEGEIKEILKNVPGVHNIHKVRNRGERARAFIELHIIASPDKDVTYGHLLSHEIERILKERYGEETQVNVHVEPDDGRCKT